MAVVVRVAKAVNPQPFGWRQRIQQNQGPLRAAFLAWATELQALVQDSQVTQAIISRSVHAFDHLLQMVTFAPSLAPAAEQEAEQEFKRIVQGTDTRMRLSFDLHDPNFARAVQQHEARLVREISSETRRAIGNMIERGYRQGIHPYDVAPQIRAAVGLTSRQGQAVLNYSDALTKKGVGPKVVSVRAERYAQRMLARRSRTIAVTETARAQVTGRLASYEQAADRGLFNREAAELEWSSVQTDPTEICAQLDGQRVPYGQDFDGLLPPVHPMCRCSVALRLD